MLQLGMKESDGDNGFEGDEISFLAEELIQLLVKSSMVEPNDKPTLICTIWTKKSYNPDSFRAHMKSIWKTRKKFEIQLERKESLKFNALSKKMQPQGFYIGILMKNQKMHPQKEEDNTMIQGIQDNSQLIATEEVTKMQKEWWSLKKK
ncbi:hypothetical protein PVK06_042983 [Gossypium arboreum]|uniref:Uncharacterized protein n=1 Tax=Gossypium arboreum TaxID=29729 RepID=A0ABR0MP15_GOSAR|nr:hypothetical protein PVK06_042983 [Gossypium arboreum]